MAVPPIPPLNIAAPTGPSQAADYGGAGDVGGMTVGDYYARGANVRQGAGWQEYGSLAAVAAVVVVGVLVWKR